MKAAAERRLLQGAMACLCLVPLTVGIAGVLESAGMLKGISDPLPVDLDSHFRYLSGLLLGVGLMFLVCIPTIEAKGPIIRVLGFLVVIGGLARLVSLLDAGVPSLGHRIGLTIELLAVPAILLWQARIARRYRS